MSRRGEHLDIRSGLLLRWRLLDTSGDALDSSVNGYDGTVTGATQSSTGVTFDGVNDEITNSDAGLTAALDDISVFTIFLRASASSYTLSDAAFSFGESNANDAFSMYPYDTASGNGCKVWFDGEYIIQGAGTAPADDTYSDFCFVARGATDMELFINGASEATSVTSKATAATMDGVTLGRYIGNGEWFPGKIGELAIWTRALTDEQVKLLSQR